LLEEIDLSFARGDFNEFRCIPTDVRPFLSGEIGDCSSAGNGDSCALETP